MPPQFQGLACFSPRVYKFVRVLWELYGGSIATSYKDLDRIHWFFAASDDVYWITRLSAFPIIIYDQMWIVESIEMGFCILPNDHVLFQSPKDASRAPFKLEDIKSLPGLTYPTRDLSEAYISEEEVEDTLIEMDDQPMEEDVTSKDDPSMDRRLDNLLNLFSSTKGPIPIPVMSVADVLNHTPPVACASLFQPGELVEGAMLYAKRHSPVIVSK